MRSNLPGRGRLSAGQVRLATRSVALLESAGLSTRDAVVTQVALAAYVLGFLIQEVGPPPVFDAGVLAAAPELARIVPVLGSTPPEQRFRAGVEALLDGAATRP